jgi:hypothetical protein
MKITGGEITGFLQEPEGVGFEFKEAKSGFHFDRLVEARSSWESPTSDHDMS